MTIEVGRAKVIYPVYGKEYGTDLYDTLVEGMQYFSDHLTSRWYDVENLADTVSVNLAHNFGLGLDDISYEIIESGIKLTRSEAASNFELEEVDGNTLSITNKSGESKTFSIMLSSIATGAEVNYVLTPECTNITEGDTEINPRPTIQLAPFRNIVNGITHKNTDWKIFVNGVLEEEYLNSTSNKTSLTTSGVYGNSTIRVEVLFRDGDDRESEVLVLSFETAEPYTVTPSITSPSSGDAFKDGDTVTSSSLTTYPTGGTHESSSWEIRKTSDNTLVASSYGDTTNLTSWTPDLEALEEEMELEVRVKYISTEYGESDWSPYVVFNYLDQEFYLAVAHIGGNCFTVFSQDLDTFTKLSTPAIASTGRGCAFSADGTYLAVAHSSGNYFTVFKRSGDTFTALTTPAIVNNGYGCAFSADGTYLAVAHNAGDGFTVFKRSGDTFTKLTTPAIVNAGYGCAFSADGTYLAVAHSSGNNLTVFKRSGDTFTALPTPAVDGMGRGCAFSADGTYLAVAHTGGDGFTVFKRSGDTFTALSTPAVDGTGYGCAFSADGTYLAVAHNSGNNFTVFKRSGDTFTALTTPAIVNNGYGCAFSADGTYLAVAHSSGNNLTVFKRSGDTFTKLTTPAVDSAGYGCAFFPVAVPGSR
jgi:6-phosphogluconolactonase (cycloisomerase 2 family)